MMRKSWKIWSNKKVYGKFGSLISCKVWLEFWCKGSINSKVDWALMFIFRMNPFQFFNILRMKLVDFFIWNMTCFVPFESFAHHRHQINMKRKEPLQKPSPINDSRQFYLIQEHSERSQPRKGPKCLVLIEAQDWVYGIAVSNRILDKSLSFLHVHTQLFFCCEGRLLEPSGQHADGPALLH